MNNRSLVLTVQILWACALGCLAQPGTTNWTFSTGAGILSSPALGPDGTLYFGSYDQSFYAINPDGTLKWSRSVSSERNNEATYILSSPALSEAGSVYFGVEHLKNNGSRARGQFYSLKSTNGALNWVNTFDNGEWAAIYSDPAIGPDGTIYFGCYDTNFYALNPDGTERWRFTPDDQIYSDAVVGPDGRIYFGCDDGKIYCLNGDGTLRWTFRGGHGITGSPVLGPDNTLYFGSTWDYGPSATNGTKRLFAVNPDGTERWQFRADGFVESSPALGSDGTIYFGSTDAKVYALHSDGTLKWEFLTGGPVKSSPALAADGTLYVGSFDNRLYALAPDGTLVWSLLTGGSVFASPTIAPDGTVYVTSNDGKLYSIAGSSPLATTPAPMFRQNPRHTAAPTNRPPALDPLEDIVIIEGSSIVLTNQVSDLDLPFQSLEFSLLPAPPDGADFDTATGWLTWTTSEADGPAIHHFTLTVTDNGFPRLSATQTVTLTVLETNIGPILAPIPDAIIPEDLTFSFIAQVDDPDLPPNPLEFNLGPDAPAGAQINPVTGLFSWTPSEEQGPGTNTITLWVTDHGAPSLSHTQQFTVIVLETNSPPLFHPLPVMTVAEEQTLTFTASAFDPDEEPNEFVFSLAPDAPPGAAINPTNGVFTWTPSEAEGPSTNLINLVASETVFPFVAQTHGVTVIVIEINQPPTLDPIPDATIHEDVTFTFTALASDPDLPSNPFTFSLITNAPPKATIDPVTGIFRWAPSETWGPGTYPITVHVSDNGQPPLTDSQSFILTVLETNSPPSLEPISDQTIVEGTSLIITNLAIDPDPGDSILRFSLAPGAPAEATINSTNGLFVWATSEADGPSTNTITVEVTDNALNPLTATQTFTITVLESNSPPVMAPLSDRTVHQGTLISLLCTASDSDLPANQLVYEQVSGPTDSILDPQTGLLTWTASAIGTNQFEIRVQDEATPPATDSKTFSITVVPPPVIVSVTHETNVLTLRWTSATGQGYRVQSTEALDSPAWLDVSTDLTATSEPTEWSQPLETRATRFYRILVLP